MIDICDEQDKRDPNFGPADTWPMWCDRDLYCLGAALTLDELGPDQLPGEEQPLDPRSPTPDQGDPDHPLPEEDPGDVAPLFPDEFPPPDDGADFEELAPDDQDDTPTFTPDPRDVAFLVEEHARREYEVRHGCNARFV